ncbi:hypothetical protein M501DRAFT_1018778 [Patellaria atrata CBS 101060]|uniref:DUF7730 domain-containing protein n=1 Tax=Patellaria atrata CBS 101060 TaxID=1346257 RepID=A0A9P4S5J7_9PEZI|nr:hypothetical protein M501DRAFT_1018778 [Patellaria atrata CBS 101060]
MAPAYRPIVPREANRSTVPMDKGATIQPKARKDIGRSSVATPSLSTFVFSQAGFDGPSYVSKPNPFGPLSHVSDKGLTNELPHLRASNMQVELSRNSPASSLTSTPRPQNLGSFNSLDDSPSNIISNPLPGLIISCDDSKGKVNCYIQSGCRFAEKDGQGGYVQHITLRSSEPFSVIDSTMLNERLYQGKQALVIHNIPPSTNTTVVPRPETTHLNSGHSPFLKLPAEIRNMIYELVLVVPGGMFFGVGGRGSNISNGAVRKKRNNDGRKKNQKKGIDIPSIEPGLLRVNRQIYEEAHKIVVSQNVFNFTSSTVVSNFLAINTPVKSYITHIHITSYVNSTGPAFWSLLANCRNITRVVFHYSAFAFYGDDGCKAAKAIFKDGGVYFKAAYRRTNDKLAGLEVINLDFPVDTYRPNWENSYTSLFRRFEKSFRDHLQGLLEGMDDHPAMK